MKIDRFGLRALCASSLAIGAASAFATLDQQNLSDHPGGLVVANDRTQIQTFTVGITGLLTSIDFNVAKSSNTTASLDAALWTTDSSGLPETLIASHTFSASSASLSFSLLGWDTSSLTLAVTTGTLLALTLDSLTPLALDEWWIWAYEGQYAGGKAYTKIGPSYGEGGDDLQFRTFVNAVPEPAHWALLLTGAALILRRVSARNARKAC